MKESLLGFQLRVLENEIPTWPEKSRMKFFLTEVRNPLSVDNKVWPVLDSAQAAARLFAMSGAVYPGGLGLFPELYTREGQGAFEGSLIAITLVSSPDMENRLRESHKIDRSSWTIARLQERGFDRLGFDIADMWLLSGLMNCFVSEEMHSQLRSRYGARLNSRGLFHDLSDAEEFREECDSLIKEHAPFLIYGLWTKR